MTAGKDLPEGLRDPKDPDRPVAVLTFERCLCTRHGEPFRSEWPSGFMVFSLKGLQKLGIEAPDGLPANQVIGWIELQLSERPICCRLTREQLLPLYLESKKWKRRICVNCKELREGSPCKTRGDDGKLVDLRHVCLWCVLWKWMPHENAPHHERERFEREERQERGEA